MVKLDARKAKVMAMAMILKVDPVAPRGPSLADDNKIGFFSLDQASQTDITEVVDLKEMTEVLQLLLQDVSTIRRDINFTKMLLQADYSHKIQEKAIDLYCRINEHMTNLEKLHQDKLNELRQAYRQQLANAIALIDKRHKDSLEQKLWKQKVQLSAGLNEKDGKYRELQQTIQRNESVIAMLQQQLIQVQASSQRYSDSMSNLRSDNSYDQSPTTMHTTRFVVSRRSSFNTRSSMQMDEIPSSPASSSKNSSSRGAIDVLERELKVLTDKLEKFEEALDSKTEESESLVKEVEMLHDEIENLKQALERLKSDKKEMKAIAIQDKEASKRLVASQMSKKQQDQQQQQGQQQQQQQGQQQQGQQQHQQQQHQQQRSPSKQQHRGSVVSNKDTERIKQLMEEKVLLQDRLMKEQAKNGGREDEAIELMRLQTYEQRSRLETSSLRKEVEKINKIWEKKFAILQQSLHALKDESYLRHTLQRQAAQLHNAAVSYAVDTPRGIMPSKQNKKAPLPDIAPYSGKSGQRGGGGGGGDKDYISYTVSAPSGRGTAMFSADENQVLSDDQDLPDDVVLLPSPPRLCSGSQGDSRPSTSDVVMPIVEAK